MTNFMSIAALAAFATLFAPGSAIDPRVVTSGVPTSRGLVEKRTNGCPGINPLGGSTPFQSYTDGQPGGCPAPVNNEDASGTCRTGMQLGSTNVAAGQFPWCASYCEVRNYFFYDLEVPFTEFPPCRANQPCSFTSTHSVTVTKTYEFNTGVSFSKRDVDGGTEVATRDLSEREDGGDVVGALEAAFSFGASYSYSVSTTSSTGLTLSRPTDTMASCGYWTFVPIMWTSCGTMSTMQAASHEVSWRGPVTYSCNTQLQIYNTPNWCQTSPYLDANGNVAGATVFVLTDCDTNAKLPKAQQDPIYQYGGVSDTPLS